MKESYRASFEVLALDLLYVARILVPASHDLILDQGKNVQKMQSFQTRIVKCCVSCGSAILSDDSCFIIRANKEGEPSVVCYDCALRTDLFSLGKDSKSLGTKLLIKEGARVASMLWRDTLEEWR